MFATKDPLDVRKELLSQYTALQWGEHISTMHHRTGKLLIIGPPVYSLGK